MMSDEDIEITYAEYDSDGGDTCTVRLIMLD